MGKKIKKPRAIVFALKHPYVNPTHDVLFECLSHIFDITFYGPGYVNFDELDNDLYEAYQKLGSFDAAFIWDCIYGNPESYDLEIHFKNKNLRDFGENFERIPVPKFLICRTDPYACPKTEMENIIKFPGIIIGIPSSFCSPNEFRERNAEIEKFPFPATPYYEEAMTKREKQIIPMCHIVDEMEFCKPASSHRFDISVPGAFYYERTRIYDFLKNQQSIKTINKYKILTYLELLEYVLKANFISKTVSIHIKQRLFRRLINNSFATYTEGSQFAYPIRKFFEIPALGSILLCSPFHNHERLGFREGENFLNVTTGTILDTYHRLKKEPDYAKYLRDNGQNLIAKTHTKKAWIQYLGDVWELVKNDRFDGCEWKEGKLCIQQKQ